MLKLAYPYKEQLNQKYIETTVDEKYKYYHADTYADFNIELVDSTWTKLQMVSVNKDDEVTGFFSASIDRGDERISSLLVMNFGDINFTFSQDFYRFLHDLFLKFNFRKMCFAVVVGNPAEKMYDRYIERYNGRVVGTRKKEVRLFDREYYDLKIYEIFRDDFLAAKEKEHKKDRD